MCMCKLYIRAHIQFTYILTYFQRYLFSDTFLIYKRIFYENCYVIVKSQLKWPLRHTNTALHVLIPAKSWAVGETTEYIHFYV